MTAEIQMKGRVLWVTQQLQEHQGMPASFIFWVWMKRTKKMSVHKSLWSHLELCLHWALLSENVVVVSDRFRNLKNVYVGLKQLFHLEKKTNKRVVAYEHFPCHQNNDAKKKKQH